MGVITYACIELSAGLANRCYVDGLAQDCSLAQKP